MVLKQVMVNKYYLAIDIGASSGRHIVGWLEDNEIKTDEVFRFPNVTKMQNGHLIWNITSLFDNVMLYQAFKSAGAKCFSAEDIFKELAARYVFMNG